MNKIRVLLKNFLHAKKANKSPVYSRKSCLQEKVLFTGESPVYILLNIYQSEVDDLDIHRIAEKFAACNERRRAFFGSFD